MHGWLLSNTWKPVENKKEKQYNNLSSVPANGKDDLLRVRLFETHLGSLPREIMHPLEKKITQLVSNQELFVPGDAVIVGVSAGPDSMALLHLLVGFREQLTLDLTAVYVDHGLRPDETKAEAELVKEAAAKLAVGFELIEVNVNSQSAQQKKSLEHMARDLRYHAFDKVAKKVAATKIAVAHTADDQAEEVLIRLLRGAGRGGLSGMKIMREGRVVRPLLTTPKNEILAYLKARDISFLEDSSNQDLRFLRNQVRMEILPFLEKYNPAIHETLRRNAAILQDEEDLLANEAKRCWQEVVVEEKSDENGLRIVTIDLPNFLQLHTALQRRISEMMLLTMKARPDGRQIEQFVKLAKEGQGGSQLHFSKGLRIKKQKGKLFCSYPKGWDAGRGSLGS